MPYERKNVTIVRPAGIIGTTQYHLHALATNDARAVVETAGYLNDWAANVNTGDAIIITMLAQTAPISILYSIVKTGLVITLVRTPLT
jgi:hypothetical protein